MTTKEAIWVVKQTSLGNRVKIKFNRQDDEIMCMNITNNDFENNCKFASEHGFQNPWVGIYVDVDKKGKIGYGLCVKDLNADCIYSCDIKDLELVRNEM